MPGRTRADGAGVAAGGREPSAVVSPRSRGEAATAHAVAVTIAANPVAHFLP